jgi:8-oxo-dGTP diphosphatase
VESVEVGYFPVEQGLKKVTWGNFRQRIELALQQDEQPFLIEFFEKDTV